MKTTFGKNNPRNEPGVSMHSCYDYKSTNYYCNNYQKPQQSREDYKKIPPSPRKTNIICYVWRRRGHKAFDFRNKRQSDFCRNIRTYSKGQTYFFALGYVIISDKTNLLVNCGATNHVITDQSQNFEPGNHFVELADGSQANNIVMKKGDACIYLSNSKGHVDVS